MTNRTNESLLERRARVEKADDGPWEALHSNSDTVIPKKCGPHPVAVATCFGDKANAAFIAANSPDVVMGDIDEILRLRAEVDELKLQYEMLGECAAELEKEAEWLANVLKQGCHSVMDDDDCFVCPATLCSILCPCPRKDCRHIQAKDWRKAARKAVARGE